MTIGTSDGQQFDSEFDMHIARSSYQTGIGATRDWVNRTTPNDPSYNPHNVDAPLQPKNEYTPSNLGPLQPWDRLTNANDPQFNTPKVIKDQSRVPPTMAPNAPQLPAGEFNQPIRYPGTFQKDSLLRTHDVPLAASAIIDKEGNPTGQTAIDKDIPPHPEFDQFVHLHEQAEATHMKNLIDAGQDPVEAYREAHDRIATPIETAAVRAHAVRTGRNPDQYLDEYKAHWREGAAIAAQGPFDNINPDAHTTRYGLDKAELPHLAMNFTPPDDPWTEGEKLAGLRFGTGMAGPGKASAVNENIPLERRVQDMVAEGAARGLKPQQILDKATPEQIKDFKEYFKRKEEALKNDPYYKATQVQRKRKEIKLVPSNPADEARRILDSMPKPSR